jgi:hypothetical protein
MTGGDCSPQRNDVPANLNYSYDPSLAGSSSLALQHPTLPSYSKPTQCLWSSPFVYERLIDQGDYGNQIPQSGPQTSSNSWPGGFDPTLASHPYPSPSPQPIQGDISAVDWNHSTALPSNFPQMITQVSPATQSMGYQQHDNHHTGDVRHSFLRFYSPTAQHPTVYPLPSPPRTNSSQSHPGTSLVPPSQPSPRRASIQWPIHTGTPISSPSNAIPFTQHHNDSGSQSQHYSTPSNPSNNSSLTSSLSSCVPTSYPREAPHDQYDPYYHLNNDRPLPGPQFSAQPAQQKRKRATESHSPPPSQQKRRRVSPTYEQPFASSSRVTLDTPLPTSVPRNVPRAPRRTPKVRRKTKTRDEEEPLTPVSAPTQALRIIGN